MRRMTPLLMAPAILWACTQDYELSKGPVDVDPGEVTDCDFTQVGSTDFYRYDCNPVFSTTDEQWAQSVGGTAFLVTQVLGHPFYQLWYTGYREVNGNASMKLGYAVSPEGTDWESLEANPILDTPGGSAWDGDSMDGLSVLWDPYSEQYVMMYQGINYSTTSVGLGVATSPDGQDWTRMPDNPVMDMMSSVGSVQSWCWPLDLNLGNVEGYTGYVAGAEEMTIDDILNGELYPACEAYKVAARNVNNWSFTDQRVLPAGESGEWDDRGFTDIAVAELDGRRYMFYVGFSDWTEVPESTFISATHVHLGMATEVGDPGSDIWQKESTYIPVDVDPADGGAVRAVAASTVGSRIHLWITDNYDGEGAVGYFLFDPNRSVDTGE